MFEIMRKNCNTFCLRCRPIRTYNAVQFYCARVYALLRKLLYNRYDLESISI